MKTVERRPGIWPAELGLVELAVGGARNGRAGRSGGCRSSRPARRGSAATSEPGELGDGGAITCRQAGSARDGTGERAGPCGGRDGDWRASAKLPTGFFGMQKLKTSPQV